MKATKVLLILALMVMLSNEVASMESINKGDCKPVVLRLGDKCTQKRCNSDCIHLGGTHGNCIDGPACNCVLCGPPSGPASAPQ
ncbi:hypothetical protein SETIT_6G033900v2 [Setaria italica]|uniref:Knottin scorpion toxin-like domain-containing protein n=1 Tax=Setaria italica TaxID=4555 RepID=K3YKJ4_SETIT|nr:hypothetical protein SETIT_6G033900v2 [Setaria italica]